MGIVQTSCTGNATVNFHILATASKNSLLHMKPENRESYYLRLPRYPYRGCSLPVLSRSRQIANLLSENILGSSLIPTEQTLIMARIVRSVIKSAEFPPRQCRLVHENGTTIQDTVLRETSI